MGARTRRGRELRAEMRDVVRHEFWMAAGAFLREWRAGALSERSASA